jgi:hypothetical protein
LGSQNLFPYDPRGGRQRHFAEIEKPLMFSDVIRDRYRCPEGIIDLGLTGELSSDAGFFRLGADTICYGRSCSGMRHSRPDANLHDALQDVRIGDGKLKLPFDPCETIQNLRLERYPHSTGGGSENILRKLYYQFRPLTTASMRAQVKKVHARNWREIPFPCWPVDTTVERICEGLLLQAMRAQGIDKVPFIWFWPQGARAAAVMTHDVETAAGLEFCEALLDLDEALGFKASFLLVPEDRYSVPMSLLDAIRDRGFEVGVQDLNHDGKLFDNREEFRRRAALINRYGKQFDAAGFRAAVLYRKPEWYGDLEFSYDMSIPNVAHLDAQRGGCCTVMPYFIGNILELPVTAAQDYALFYLLQERSIDLWKKQSELILDNNGLLNFIVHPDYIIEQDARAMYVDLLTYLRELDRESPLWFALPRDVDSWWRARSRMELVKVGDSWKIEGVGSERAVLAFAEEVDGKVVYQLEQAASTVSAPL